MHLSIASGPTPVAQWVETGLDQQCRSWRIASNQPKLHSPSMQSSPVPQSWPATIGAMDRVDPTPGVPFLPPVAWVDAPDPAPLLERPGGPTFIHFWRATDLPSLHTLPALRAWHARSFDGDIQLIGFHVPRYDFDQLLPNLRWVVRRLGLRWPVALDEDGRVSDLFRVGTVPALVLVDPSGKELDRWEPPNDYAQLLPSLEGFLGCEDKEIQGGILPNRELLKAPRPLELHALDLVGASGSEGPLINRPLPLAGGSRTARLQGGWRSQGGALFAETAPASIQLLYWACDVHAVLGPASLSWEHGPTTSIEVRLGGEPVDGSLFGPDLFLAGGRTILRLEGPRLYHLLGARSAHAGQLTLEPQEPGLKLYALTLDTPLDSRGPLKPTSRSA